MVFAFEKTIMLRLLFAFLPALLVGFITADACFKQSGSGVGAFILKCSLGAGLGMGICSLLYFLLLPIYPSLWLVLAVELGFFLCVFATSSFFRRLTPASLFTAAKPALLDASKPSNLLLSVLVPLLFAFSLGNVVVSFILNSLSAPHGGWDAWSIWNLKARFIYGSKENWSIIFSKVLNYSHTDYPLLLPGFIARTWLILQQNSLAVPICVAGFFALAILGLLTASVALLKDKTQGYIAGLILLSTPCLIGLATSQYADVPLAFFFLAVIVVLTFAEQASRNNKPLYMLAGLLAGLAAWTKNEGLLFVVAIVVSRVVIAYLNGWKKGSKEISYFIAGLTPVLLVLIYFKVHFAPANDLVDGQNISTLHKLTSPTRYYLIIHALIGRSIAFSGLRGIPIVLLIAYAVMFNAFGERKKSNMANVLAIAITLLGYFFVYVVTPHDLAWHLDTSLERLLFHLFPSALFSYAILVASPAAVLQLKNVKESTL